MKEFFQGRDKLTKSATENSTPLPHSQRTVNTLTSDGHETPPENPATELNTNSMLQITEASNKHLLMKPLKFLKVLS